MYHFRDPSSHNDFIFSLKSDYKKQKSACNYAHGFSSNLIWLRRKSLASKIKFKVYVFFFFLFLFLFFLFVFFFAEVIIRMELY